MAKSNFQADNRLQTVREEKAVLDDNVLNEISFENLMEPFATFQPLLMTTD